jgi:hypothetical protein
MKGAPMASQRITILGTIGKDRITRKKLPQYCRQAKGLPVVFCATWLDTWSLWGALFHLVRLNPSTRGSNDFVILTGKKMDLVNSRCTKLLKHPEAKHDFETRLFVKALHQAIILTSLQRGQRGRVYILMECLGPSILDEDIKRAQDRLRKYARKGTYLSDSLLADRREECS